MKRSEANSTAEMNKFSRQQVMRPAKIKKGKTRWNQCEKTLKTIDRNLLSGPILDFGSGVGYFVHEGLQRGLNVWGVDILHGKIRRFKNLIEFSNSPLGWRNRCLLGDGTSLPFQSGTFTAVTSWFVFEHIPNTGEVLRELARIIRPGGVIVIRAQDARCCYEGHCKIPWVPFLPPRLQDIWIKEFGKSPALRQGVVEITQPQVTSILENLGFTIDIEDAPLPEQPSHLRNCHTEDQVRDLARQTRQLLDNGQLHLRQDGLYIYARKPSVPTG